MKLLWCVVIDEKNTRIGNLIRCNNRTLAAVFAFIQLTVAAASLFQHVYSIIKHHNVFLCKSNLIDNTHARLLAYDIIIFDFGLMHRVLGTEKCVANYLDGGYMRFGWCIEQTSALSLTIFALLCMPEPLWLLWPGLLMQSAYSLGLSVLSMATAPKILEALGGRNDIELSSLFFIYVLGFLFNWLFTLILWHYYWYLERIYNERSKEPLISPRSIEGGTAV